MFHHIAEKLLPDNGKSVILVLQNLYPKLWDIYTMTWDVHTKAWDINTKAWDECFVTKEKKFWRREMYVNDFS